jgi:hypothetical protein
VNTQAAPLALNIMRLLDVATYTLQTFDGTDIPPYAILSHRWEQEEVTYDDITKGIGPSRQGWAKIVGFSKQAAEVGFNYCVSQPFQARIISC